MCGPPTRKYTSESVIGLAGSTFFAWPLPGWPTWSSTGDSTVPASIVTPATTMPGASATFSGTAPSTAVSVAWPMPSTTVSARFTLIVLSMSYTPGVSSRCLPFASAELIEPTESPGFAMWKSVIGIVRPGVSPSAHVMPRVSVCASGTRTA